MAATIESNSLNWAELVEWMETDSDPPSECELTETAGKKTDKTETKPVRCKQVSHNDLRKKQTFDNDLRKKQTFDNDLRKKQTFDNDLRKKLMPDDDLRKKLMPDDDLRKKLMPDDDLRKKLMPDDDLRKKLMPDDDLRKKLMPDTDLRKRLNKTRGWENEDGLHATTLKSENQARSVGNKCTQGVPTHDLRRKLNGNSEETVHDSNSPQRGKQSPMCRSKYTERLGGLSPLRSPIDRSKQKTIFDIDNSRNFRFTKHLGAASQTLVKPLYNGERKKDHKCKSLPSRSERDKCLVKSDDIYTSPEPGCKTSLSDCDRETPEHSLTPRQNLRHSWSRRKLLLPSESNGHEDVSIKRIPEAKEDDEFKLARREKDILYGKNTPAYGLYVNKIPVKERIMGVHPRTPDKFRKCSRRSWDAQVRIWKRRLHEFTSELNQDKDLIDILLETHLRVDDSSSEPKIDDEDFLDIFDEDTIDLLEKSLITDDA